MTADGAFTPVCSVCIANYNGAAVIEDCLDSVFEQDCDFPFEVIVHDDASTDDSADIVRDRYPSVTLITSKENVGFCASNNRMAEAAHGRYILLLNNDAVLFPDALRTLCAAAGTGPASGILGLPQYDAATRKLIDFGSQTDPFLNPIPNVAPRHGDVAMVIGACLWVPTHLWRELGGFPEWFGSLAEDMYLCCAARLEGHEVRVIPLSGFYHWLGHSLGGGGNVTAGQRWATTRRRRVLSERNKARVMVMTYPAPFFQCVFPLFLILFLAEGVTLSLLKGDRSLLREIYLAALRSLWQDRKRLLRLRRELQAKRRIGRWEFFAVFKWYPHKLGLLLKHGLPELR